MTGKRLPPPLDDSALRDMALRHVARFATSRGKLLSYLKRKIKERGWGGEQPADPDALADRFVDLGYIDDAGYAVMKSGALARRGYGARRIDQDLRAAGIAEEDREQADAQIVSEAWAAADRFARRKRVGPYAPAPLDPRQREKAIAAFLRAGHDYAVARRWVDAPPGEEMTAEED
ncbi:RecX family transcriptional regulator [Sphingobium sp. HBC34]|uniref:Regulatory protein RecX n=1 Tax=Sphingobium cyanobacteriorum TaxID=3063954 RepID=A0ABT8ZP65_9SPHN|nr:RecX family transcriptional regulator [Sphingobium sp. HBC34]MDO7836001.1 RecX family transcriptional regulator [Sphingobium sp. HBC34]